MWQRYNQTSRIFEKSTDNGGSWTPMLIAASGIEGGNFAYTDRINTGHLTSSGTIRSQGARGTPPASGGGIELFYQDGIGYVHVYDTAGIYPMMYLYAGGIAYTTPGGVFSTSGNVQVGTDANKGNLNTTYPIYPGRLDTGWTLQNYWYLGSHVAYGLYSNTGLYLNGDFTTAGIANITGAANTGSLTVTGNIRATGTIGCDTNQWRSNFHPHGNIYMGVGGAASASYYITGNDTYGIYCNTGLYLEYYIWPLAIEARAHIRAAQGLYDYGRANPIGVWIGFTAGAWANGGGISGGSATLNYMLVGKSMTIVYQISSIYVNGGVTEIYITIPVACSTGMVNITGTVSYFNGQQWDGVAGGALAYCMNGEAFIRFYRTQGFTASNDVGGSLTHLWGQIVVPIA